MKIHEILWTIPLNSIHLDLLLSAGIISAPAQIRGKESRVSYGPPRCQEARQTPLNNMSSSVGMMTFPIFLEQVKKVPNHQPVYIYNIIYIIIYIIYIIIYNIIMYYMHKYFINPICICVCCTVRVLSVKIQGQDSPRILLVE